MERFKGKIHPLSQDTQIMQTVFPMTPLKIRKSCLSTSRNMRAHSFLPKLDQSVNIGRSSFCNEINENDKTITQQFTKMTINQHKIRLKPIDFIARTNFQRIGLFKTNARMQENNTYFNNISFTQKIELFNSIQPINTAQQNITKSRNQARRIILRKKLSSIT